MMTILVTGGAGYIGSHCVQQLLANGYKVIILDDYSTGHPELALAPVVVGRLQDTALVTSTLLRYNIKAVMHFAAYSQVGESAKNPLKYYYNNTAGALSLFSAMQQAGVKHLISSSTAAVYGNPLYSPMDEKHPTKPVNHYGQSKLYMEEMLQKFSVQNGLRYVTFRYFNAAGADPDSRVGEWHDPETHLIPNVLKSLLLHKPLNVFGSDYDTPDGTCVRDYVHVKDIVAAHVLALNYLQAGGASEVFNLGTENGYSVREVIAACEQVTREEAILNVCDRREGDPPTLVASAKKAKTLLSWQPVYTNLAEVIETAWNWEQKLQTLQKEKSLVLLPS